MLRFLRVSLIFLAFCNAALAKDRDNVTCDIEPGQPLKNAYGPWDYTNSEHADKLPIVLGAHFTKEVASLIKGATDSTPHHDIDYTLRAIPNYHPALYAVAKLERIDRAKIHPGQLYSARFYTADCYFNRAVYLNSKDATVYMLWGLHLQVLKNYQAAERKYQYALALQPDNIEIHYNLGLLYIDTGRIAEAKKHADVAYAAGYPLPGLHNKIAALAKELSN